MILESGGTCITVFIASMAQGVLGIG
jgi:hypothetical protein